MSCPTIRKMMKEKRKTPPGKDALEPVVSTDNSQKPEALPEFLSELDKGLIDNTKLKRELALERVKNALSQSENAELLYNNVILQLAMKYKLKEGDIITEDGTIKRTQ
jgi:hypothetical protein